MASKLRKTGISVVGDVSWGTHFCHFYETKQDLLDILVPYFKAGLESNEFCMWVVSTPDLVTVEEAKGALAQAVPDLDGHLSDENIEILKGLEWYLEENIFNLESVTRAWDAKLKRALARGYDGMRVSGDTFWLAEKDWNDFFAYEKQLNESITDQPMTVLCTYPLAKSGAAEVLDVVQAHQFAIARRQGEWEVIETPQLIQAKAEIKKLNDELEQRVIERTTELRVANEDLRKEIAERKQAEALLLAKEQEFRAIVENAPDQIIRYDRDFRRTYVNPAVAQFYGLPAETLIGKPLGSDIPKTGLDVKEDELAQVRKRIAAVFETGESFEYELTWTMPTGRRYFSIRLFPELDLNGSVVNVLGISRDITARRSAEDELQKEKEILEKIFDNIPVMIGFVGDDGVRLVNPEWERTIGWTQRELQEQNVDIFVEAYPDPQYRQEVLDFVAAATGEWADLKIKLRDGRVIDAACAVVRLSYGTKVAIAQDITERKQAEDVLRRSEDRLRLVIDTTPVMAWSIRPDGVVDFLNQRWMDYAGLSLEQYVQDPTGPIHPEDLPRVVENWRRNMAAGEPNEDEIRLRRADGEYRWFLVRNAPLRDEQGNVVKWYGVSIDIEERKRAEEALDERLRFETLVTELSAAFANLSPNEVDREIDKWLQTLADFLGVDRASFFQFAEDWTTLHRSHSYTVPGIEPLSRPPIGMNEQFPWITDQLRRGVTVKWARIPNDMPEEAAKEKEYAARLGTKSALNIPVLMGGSVICAIMFTSIATYRDWPDATVARLRLVGEIFAAAVERKRAEERIKATTEQLRALSASLQSAREEEGTRIARELHDELGGGLTSLKWALESFDKVVAESPDRPQLPVLRERIQTMLRISETMISTVRRISSELRPSVLDDLGLVEAIEWQVREFQARTGIICHYECSRENVDLNQEESTAVFRIFQEALTNILRHAQATRVDIVMKEDAGEFVLSVSDNGKGITEDDKSRLQSLGLLGMRERAHLIGGEIDIVGLEGQGTVVTVRAPLKRVTRAGRPRK